jgi:hydrogenase-4 component F
MVPVIPALIMLPLLAGTLAFFLRGDRVRRALLVAVPIAHAGLLARAWFARPLTALGGWLALGSLELLFLGITSVLTLAAAIYAVGYLAREKHPRPPAEDGFLFSNAPEATFTGCFLLFLGTMTLVIASQHFGLMWVAVEATTLASAPLIHFHRNSGSLEAAWKYLLICSVGIAIALLGNFFLVVASSSGSGPLTVAGLVRQASLLDPVWLKAAFLLLLVGYGTKMGLAPLHTWLPDAHSEAPSVVSALLSGALLNCAFLAILRVHAVCVAAGLGAFSGGLLVLLGLVSMGFAAAFIVGQADYKRMLAYSSVEHMGIAALGVGLGGAAGFGALLHTVNHSLTKAMLFLLSGNILAAYQDKSTTRVNGMLRVLPITGVLWVAGFFAITGTPPFGLFVSEFTILKGALDGRHWLVAVLYLVFLTVIFVGMAGVFLRMSFGEREGAGAQGRLGAPEEAGTQEGPKTRKEQTGAAMVPSKESILAWLPPLVLGMGVLVLGLWIPLPLRETINTALRALGVQ